MKNLFNRLTLLTTAGVICMAYTTSSLLSNPNCPAGYTGAPKATSPNLGQVRYCTSCHGDYSLNPAGGGITVTGLPVGTYSAGRAYPFSIAISHASANRKVWGFAIKAVNLSDNMVVGTFSSTNANATVKGTVSGNTAELSHAVAAVTGLASAYSYINLTWTAPATPLAKEANIRFYITANAGDNDGSEAGDYIYTKTMDASLQVLPVQLNSFGVSALPGGAVQARWTTSQEENSALFTLEASSNGIAWTFAGQLQAAGFSGTERSYVLNDLHPTADHTHRVYYRLKMTDADGRVTYSDIRTVILTAGSGWVKVLNPKPVSAGTEASFEVGTEKGGAVSVILYDASGRSISTRRVPIPAGTSIYRMAMPEQKGIYFIRFTGEGWQQTLPCSVE